VSSSEPSRRQATDDRDGDVPRRRTPFLQQSYGDMMRSMVLLAILVALAYGCSQLMETEPEEPVEVIDYSSELRGAEELADYEVLAPEGLPPQWRATSADIDRSGGDVAWHLGFLNPDNRYVGLEQTDGELPLNVATLFEGRQASDTVSSGGLEWQVFSGAEGADNVLVHVDGDVTTVVHGSPPVEELVTFADSLL
jgi:hypothetical protein